MTNFKDVSINLCLTITSLRCLILLVFIMGEFKIHFKDKKLMGFSKKINKFYHIVIENIFSFNFSKKNQNPKLTLLKQLL